MIRLISPNTNGVPLDKSTLKGIIEMYYTSPSIVIARKAFLSMLLHEPFQYSIPKLGIQSNGDMTLVIATHWMPWLWTVYDWTMVAGVIPWKMVKRGPHLVPISPTFDQGEVWVIQSDGVQSYRWYPLKDNGTLDNEHDTKMRWFPTNGTHPNRDGTLRCPLLCLLPHYRSLVKLRQAQDLVATQLPRPIHLLERRTVTPLTAPNPHLTNMTATLGAKVAGIGQVRRQAMLDDAERRKQSELFRHMNNQASRNMERSATRPILPTDEEAQLYDEMDYGFGNRLIVLPPEHTYRESARPTMPFDLTRIEDEFNVLAAAVMDYSFEIVKPSGGANRTQNTRAADRFEQDRIHQQTSFFTNIIHVALVMAYRKQFQEMMDGARRVILRENDWIDPARLAHLYPELDVVVKMTSSSTTSDADLRQLRMDGLISQETMGKYIFRNKNLPVEDMTSLAWPDNIPRELLVKSTNADSGALKKSKKRERGKEESSKGTE